MSSTMGSRIHKRVGFAEAIVPTEAVPIFKKLVKGEVWADEVQYITRATLSRKTRICFDGSHFDRIVNLLSDMLAQEGFDEEYNPNKMGVMLEAMIDSFVNNRFLH